MPEKTSALSRCDVSVSLSQNEPDAPEKKEAYETWRHAVYSALANVQLGFEQVTAALKVLRSSTVLEDSTHADMYSDVDTLQTRINYIILSELHASETANYRAVRDDDEPVPKYEKRPRARR